MVKDVTPLSERIRSVSFFKKLLVSGFVIISAPNVIVANDAAMIVDDVAVIDKAIDTSPVTISTSGKKIELYSDEFQVTFEDKYLGLKLVIYSHFYNIYICRR